MNYKDIDTPALLIDEDVLNKNIKYMSSYAEKQNVKLRPHTKTHKMPHLAQKQIAHGAEGITVAKVGEAEIMAVYGIDNIFIVNQIVGKQKLERTKQLTEQVEISLGVDSMHHIEEIDAVFAGASKKAQILIEIEVGEERSGIIEQGDYKLLLNTIRASKNIELKGIFSHDGHTYKAVDKDDC